MHLSTTLSRVLILGSLLVPCACKSESSQPTTSSTSATKQPERAEISNEFTAAADVVAVSPEERIVTLRRMDGSLFDVHAGDAVRNFEQIAVGDALRVRYQEKLTAQRCPPGSVPGPIEGGVAAARAPRGEKPGAGVGWGASMRVKIESIDTERDIVVFALASGELLAHRVRTPQGKEFLRGLAVGDVVQIDYHQAAALSIEET